MTQQTIRLVLGHAVRSGHRDGRSTAFMLSKSVTFEATLGRDVLTLHALGRNLADVPEQPSAADKRESATATVCVLVTPSWAAWSHHRSHHRWPSIGKLALG